MCVRSKADGWREMSTCVIVLDKKLLHIIQMGGGEGGFSETDSGQMMMFIFTHSSHHLLNRCVQLIQVK